ncbi:MAG: PKD domain-containing protein, partial [Cyclobacteriaceae bacterium]
LTYSWDFDGDGIEDSSQPGPSHQFATIGAKTITLEVGTTNGCSNTVSKEITLYPNLPTPDFEVTNENICSNSELSFSNLSDESAYPAGLLSYSWDFDGIGASTDTNGTFTFSQGGTKQISLTMEIPGCQKSTDKNIEVLDGAVVEFDYTNNCYNEAVKFEDQSSGENISGYSWDFGDGSSPVTVQNPTHLFANTGTFSVKLTITNTAGCENEKAQNITVNDLPLADFTISIEPTENLPITFSGIDQTLSEDAVISWEWNFGDGGNNIGQMVSYTFEDSGIKTVTLTIQTIQGCVYVVEKSVTILSSEKSTAQFDALEEVCRNESI